MREGRSSIDRTVVIVTFNSVENVPEWREKPTNPQRPSVRRSKRLKEKPRMNTDESMSFVA